jgi:hypothetical protein
MFNLFYQQQRCQATLSTRRGIMGKMLPGYLKLLMPTVNGNVIINIIYDPVSYSTLNGFTNHETHGQNVHVVKAVGTEPMTMQVGRWFAGLLILF